MIPKEDLQRLWSMLPRCWAVRRLAELVDSNRRITYGVVKPGEHDPTGTIMIRSQDYTYGWISETEFLRITPELDDAYRRSRVQEGDLLVTVVGANIGRIAEVPSWLSGANISRAVARVSLDSDRATRSYVMQYLSSLLGQSEMMKNVKGGAQPVLNLSELDDVRVPIPPAPELYAIAQVLSTWDSAIEQTERLIDAKQRRKKALMQQLLTGKKRFAEFEGEEWRHHAAGDFCEIRIGRTPSRVEPAYWADEGNGYPWASIADLVNSPVRTTSEYISHAAVKRLGLTPVRAGTCMMSFKLTIGRVAVAGVDLFTNEAIAAFEPHQDVAEKDFFRHALPYAASKAVTDTAVKGATLNSAKLKELRFKLPSLSEQRKIAAVLNTADEEVVQLKSLLAALRRQKQGLMQVLLTGKVRVKVECTPTEGTHDE